MQAAVENHEVIMKDVEKNIGVAKSTAHFIKKKKQKGWFTGLDTVRRDFVGGSLEYAKAI